VRCLGPGDGSSASWTGSRRAPAGLADLFTRGQPRILHESRHQVHFDAPEAILKAVRNVLKSGYARREAR